MNSGNIEYLNLRELSNEDYAIVDGQADITGWPVNDQSGKSIGKVRDLLFDPEHNTIRYIIIDLDRSSQTENDKVILLPIGFANLGEGKKEVIVPVLNESQLEALPYYIIGEVTRETEIKIRAVIASPTAVSMEDESITTDHVVDFYQHHHFDRGNIVSRKHETASPEINSVLTPDNGDPQQHSNQQIISPAQSNKPVESENTIAKYDPFTADVEEGAFTIEPQENGTYRIFDKDEKIGVIYAESGHEGTQWRTMDNLSDSLVINLGNAIAAHNLQD